MWLSRGLQTRAGGEGMQRRSAPGVVAHFGREQKLRGLGAPGEVAGIQGETAAA